MSCTFGHGMLVLLKADSSSWGGGAHPHTMRESEGVGTCPVRSTFWWCVCVCTWVVCGAVTIVVGSSAQAREGARTLRYLIFSASFVVGRSPAPSGRPAPGPKRPGPDIPGG